MERLKNTWPTPGVTLASAVREPSAGGHVSVERNRPWRDLGTRVDPEKQEVGGRRPGGARPSALCLLARQQAARLSCPTTIRPDGPAPSTSCRMSASASTRSADSTRT